jgi:ketosteroid isomerase-like protein
MHKIFIALIVAVLAAGPAAATDKSDVMSVIHQWVDAFNKSDAKSATAACAAQTSIIDDLPPHEWHGTGACGKWFSDFQAFAKAGEMTEVVVTVGKPKHVDVTADVAYVVAPTTISFTQRQKPVKELGTITLSLKKVAAGWRITGWAWAAH